MSTVSVAGVAMRGRWVDEQAHEKSPLVDTIVLAAAIEHRIVELRDLAHCRALHGPGVRGRFQRAVRR
jgi:hypothetical protein